MSGEPLWRGKVEDLVLAAEDALKRGLDSFDEVEVWPAADRTSPTREQLWATINVLDAAVDLNNDQIYAISDAVLALLHGQGDETDA